MPASPLGWFLLGILLVVRGMLTLVCRCSISKAMDALYVRNFPKNDGLSLVPPGAKFLFVDNCLSFQRCKRNLFADNVPERVQISRYAP
jgi:hypothetical protein